MLSLLTAFVGGALGFLFIPVRFEWGLFVFLELILLGVLSGIAANIDEWGDWVIKILFGGKKERKPVVAT